ncbi:MAG: type II toxin-antitoxin system VapC family toxin [Syntrophomonas sp.]|nr:type II toxin-antitoxin system VapC family toxin [Syntrophomonas sp.]
MSSYICLDSSVLIKVLVNEEDSDKAVTLMERVINERMTVVLPDFAWAEVGSVLRKKVSRRLINPKQAVVAWEAFNSFGVITFINDVSVMRAAWQIADKEKLPTLYDAAYLAVAEIMAKQNGEECEFWTADNKLASSVKNKSYVKVLQSCIIF